MLDLYVGHLDAPRVGLRVEDLLHVEVEAFALGEHLVKLVLAEHRTQCGLGELAGGDEEVLDLDDGLLRIDHAEEHDRIDLDRDIVARDHVLRGYVHGHHTQVDFDHLLDAGDHDHQAGALDLPEAPEQEDHAALVLAQDLDRGDDEEDEQQEKWGKPELKVDHDGGLRGVRW